MAVKKVNKEIFKILYHEGLSRAEIATYFDVTPNRISVLKCKLNLGEREIHCMDCLQLFKTKYFSRFLCDDCKYIRGQQFLFRRSFLRLQSRYPDFARKIEIEMINEDGLACHDFCIDGFSSLDEFKIKKKIIEKPNIIEGFTEKEAEMLDRIEKLYEIEKAIKKEE